MGAATIFASSRALARTSHPWWSQDSRRLGHVHDGDRPCERGRCSTISTDRRLRSSREAPTPVIAGECSAIGAGGGPWWSTATGGRHGGDGRWCFGGGVPSSAALTDVDRVSRRCAGSVARMPGGRGQAVVRRKSPRPGAAAGDVGRCVGLRAGGWKVVKG